MDTLQTITDPPERELHTLENLPEDAWRTFYLLDEGCMIACHSLRKFIVFYLSESTQRLQIGDIGTSNDTAQLKIFGPVADDEEPMLCEYMVTRAEVQALSREERLMLKEKVKAMRIRNSYGAIDTALTNKVLKNIGLWSE